MKPHTEWHSRGYLPHWEAGEVPQSICFRLADSLPDSVVRQALADLDDFTEDEARIKKRKRLEAILDQGHGSAFLWRADVAGIVQAAVLHFDGERCRIHAWCIMPNHVHVLMTPLGEHSHAALLNSWKSFTALKINHILHREGQVWYREYFDRKIRNEEHFEAARYYIEQNPVKAWLCGKPEEWVFSSAAARMKVDARS